MVWLLLLLAAPLYGQRQDVAVTDDGEHLYFSSPFRLRGTDQYPHWKLFRLTSAGFELMEQVERRYPEGGGNTSSFYAPVESEVSGGGTMLVYALRRDCIGGSSCVFVERYNSLLRRNGIAEPIAFPHKVQLSRNGSYLLHVIEQGVLPGSLTRIEVTTGARATLPAEFRVFLRRAITNSGQVLVRDPQGMALWTPSSTRRVATSTPVESAIINSAGTTIVYSTAGSGFLRSIDVTSTRETILAAGTDPVMSNDGQWVLDRSGGQAFLIRTDGTGQRQLASVREGVIAATLTGFANAAFVSTASGRLLRIDLPGGEIRELVPETPWIEEEYGAPVAGSLHWLRGHGFAAATSVTLGGARVPVLARSGEAIVFQIPFEARGDALPIELGATASPFEAAAPRLALVESEPAFVSSGREIPLGTYPNLGALVAHSDFRSLVSPADPAAPGEIVHLYATGLGPVRPPVPTGEAAPLDRLTSVTIPLQCRFLTPAPAEVLFAGLAPGLVGLYQISVRLPDQSMPAVLHCGGDGGDSAVIPISAAS